MPPKLTKGKRMPSATLKVTSRGRKKKAPPPEEDSPDSPTPPPSDEGEEVEASSRSRSRSREVTPPPQDEEASGSQALRKRAKFRGTTLTPENEDDMAEWLKSFDFIYVKGRERYKDSNMKKRIWAEQAKKLGLEVRTLMTWYDSVRSNVGKLTEEKSGSATKELTDREKHIMARFGFLKDHIVRQPSRVGSSLKAKLQALHPQSQATATTTVAATATATCSDDRDLDLPDTQVPDTQVIPETQPSTSTSVRPPSKPKGKSRSRQEDGDQLMATFRAQQEQSAELQGKIAGLLEPPKQSAAANWGNWVGTMAESFNPSLLPQFYMDSFNLVLRYQHETRQMGETQQPPQQPQPAFVPQPPQPAFVPQPQQPVYAPQPAYQKPADGQVYLPPPPLLQQQQQQQQQQQPPQRRHSSDVIDWNTPGPVSGRPSSTPAPSSLTISGLSDMTFTGLMGTPPTTYHQEVTFEL